MTTFGWDDSHYGAPPQWRDGIDFYTHKLTDGDHYYEDNEYAQSMINMRNFGTRVLGPYHVLHGGNVSIDAQAEWFVERADKWTPWWRDFEYWTWQIDSEPFDYLVRPTIDQVNYFGRCIHDLTGTPMTSILGYLPKWSYGDSLVGLQLPWWQSNYGGNPTGHYPDIYPGDNSDRWDGPIPMPLLQYGSKAIIAGQSTSDANAFRGSLDEFLKFLRPEGGDDMGDKFLAQLKSNERTNLRLCDGFEHRVVAMDSEVEQAYKNKYGAPIMFADQASFDHASGPEYVPTRDRIPHGGGGGAAGPMSISLTGPLTGSVSLSGSATPAKTTDENG